MKYGMMILSLGLGCVMFSSCNVNSGSGAVSAPEGKVQESPLPVAIIKKVEEDQMKGVINLKTTSDQKKYKIPVSFKKNSDGDWVADAPVTLPKTNSFEFDVILNSKLLSEGSFVTKVFSEDVENFRAGESLGFNVAEKIVRSSVSAAGTGEVKLRVANEQKAYTLYIPTRLPPENMKITFQSNKGLDDFRKYTSNHEPVYKVATLVIQNENEDTISVDPTPFMRIQYGAVYTRWFLVPKTCTPRNSYENFPYNVQGGVDEFHEISKQLIFLESDDGVDVDNLKSISGEINVEAHETKKISVYAFGKDNLSQLTQAIVTPSVRRDEGANCRQDVVNLYSSGYSFMYFGLNTADQQGDVELKSFYEEDSKLDFAAQRSVLVHDIFRL